MLVRRARASLLAEELRKALQDAEEVMVGEERARWTAETWKAIKRKEKEAHFFYFAHTWKIKKIIETKCKKKSRKLLFEHTSGPFQVTLLFPFNLFL